MTLGRFVSGSGFTATFFIGLLVGSVGFAGECRGPAYASEGLFEKDHPQVRRVSDAVERGRVHGQDVVLSNGIEVHYTWAGCRSEVTPEFKEELVVETMDQRTAKTAAEYLRLAYTVFKSLPIRDDAISEFDHFEIAFEQAMVRANSYAGKPLSERAEIDIATSEAGTYRVKFMREKGKRLKIRFQFVRPA
ncbi:MAG: hypothetical protein AB7P04_06210 [Bacteriovoracia bacterium]